jgi:DNA replication protein DnaC
MGKYFRMAYRIPKWNVKRREKSADYAAQRAKPRAVPARSRRKQTDRSSKPAERQHSLAASRKLTNRRVHDAFCARQKDSIQNKYTIDSESWRIPKCRHYVTGPTGIGKTWLGCALAQKACRDGFTILHKRSAELFRDLAVAHVDGSFGRQLAKLARIDILVLDDFAMAPLKDSERRDFLELCDDRYQRRSTILTSQLPLAHWHEQIGDPTLADSILDRLVHNSYRIELNGESMRKKRGRKTEEES